MKKAVDTRLYSIVNSLNHSSLKKSITMMIKKKSNPWAYQTYICMLSLWAMAIVVFARIEISKERYSISHVKVNELTSNAKADECKSVEKNLESIGNLTKKGA